jgi:hypothetical protein
MHATAWNPSRRLALLARTALAAGSGAEFEAHQRAAADAQRLLLDRLRGEAGGPGGAGSAAAGAAGERLVALLEALAEHHLRGRQLEKVRKQAFIPLSGSFSRGYLGGLGRTAVYLCAISSQRLAPKPGVRLHRPAPLRQAQEAYLEVLAAAGDHAPSLLALARIALALGDVAACQARCLALLKVDPENESAASMLAEIMFHQVPRAQGRKGCQQRMGGTGPCAC